MNKRFGMQLGSCVYLFVAGILAFVSAFPAFADESVSYNYGGINYLVYLPVDGYGGYARVVSYDRTTPDVILPFKIEYNGAEYYVSRNEINPEMFAGQDNIVTLKADIWQEDFTFRGCRNLTKVIMPAEIDWINEYQFYDCPAIDLKFMLGNAHRIENYAFAMSQPTELPLLDCAEIPNVNSTVFENRLYTSISLDTGYLWSLEDYLDLSKVKSLKCSNMEVSIYGTAFPALEKVDAADGGNFSLSGIPLSLSEIKLSGNFSRVDIYNNEINESALPVKLDIDATNVGNIQLKNFKCGNSVFNLSSAADGSVEIEQLAGVEALNFDGEFRQVSVWNMPDLAAINAKGAKLASVRRNPILEKLSLPDIERLGEGAFADNLSLKEIYVGDKLQVIDNYYNFEGCKAMSDFIYGGTIEQWLAIDNVYTSGYSDSPLFYNVPNFWYGHGDAKLTKLEELNSQHLMGVDIIRCGSFAGYKGLKKVIVPSTVSKIELRAFDYCSGIEEIDINCDTICDGAFHACTSIKKMTFGNNVEEIGSAFPSKLSTYPTVYYNGTPDQWNAVVKGWFTYNNDMYFNGTKYTDIVLHCPRKVGYGFQYSQWLNTMMIECGQDSINISSNAFEASSIKKISYTPYTGSRSATNGVFVIGAEAFKSCSNLTDIGIIDNTVSIGADAFDGTAWLEAQPRQSTLYLNLLNGKVVYKYLGVAPENTKIEIEEGTVDILPNAFFRQEGIVDFTFPSTLKNIGAAAFTGTSVGKLVIPASVETASGSLLQKIEEFIIEDSPNALAGGPNSQDFDLWGVKKIYYGRDMRGIRVAAHAGGDNISMTYGKYVTVVNQDNYIPDSTAEVHVLSTVPPTCETETDWHFNTYFTGLTSVDFDKCILYVPEMSIDDYRQAAGWNQFKNIQADYSGIEHVELDNSDIQVEIYDLSGQRRNEADLAPGIYIRRIGNNVEKIRVK